MDIQSKVGILMMLVAVAVMGGGLCFQPISRARTITSAKCIAVSTYYVGALLLEPAVVALYPRTFGYSGVMVAIYGVATIVLWFTAAAVASMLWFEFRTGFDRFDNRYKKTLTSTP